MNWVISDLTKSRADFVKAAKHQRKELIQRLPPQLQKRINECPAELSFSNECYKTVKCVFFGSICKEVKDYTYGDVVIMQNPKYVAGRGYVLTVSRAARIKHLGESDDYVGCPEKGCPAFLNKNLDKKC